MAKIMDEKEAHSTAPSVVGQDASGQTGGVIVGLLEGGRNGGEAGGSLKKNNADEGLKVGDAGGSLQKGDADEGLKVDDAGEGSKGGDAGAGLKRDNAKGLNEEGLKVGDAEGSLQKGDGPGEGPKGGNAGLDLKRDNAGEGLKGGNAGIGLGNLQRGDAAESVQEGDAGIGLGNVEEGPKGADAGKDDAGGNIVNDRAVGGANDGIQATGQGNNEVEAPASSNGDAGEENVNESDDDGVWEGSYTESTTSINRGQRTPGIRFGDCNNNHPARDRHAVRNYDQGNVNDGSGDENATTGQGNNEVEAPASSNGDAGEGNVIQGIEEIIYESDDDGVWEGSYTGSTTSINRGQRTPGIRFGDCNNNRPARDRNPVRNYDQVTVNDGSGDENVTRERRPYSRYPDYPDSRNNSDDEMSEYLYEYEENLVRRPNNPTEEQASSRAVGRVGKIRGRRRSRPVTDASPNVNKNKKRFGIRL